MRTIELFSGSKTVARAFSDRGHETWTVDNDANTKPDLVADVFKLRAADLPWRPDVVWASPPCNKFSLARAWEYWRNGSPGPEALEAIELVRATWSLIEELDPVFFFIENPKGMLRHQPFMKHTLRREITYCRYGDSVQKPTDIWTNCWSWLPRTPCRRGSGCHESAPSGTNLGLAKRRKGARAVVPYALGLEVCCAVEKEFSVASLGGLCRLSGLSYTTS